MRPSQAHQLRGLMILVRDTPQRGKKNSPYVDFTCMIHILCIFLHQHRDTCAGAPRQMEPQMPRFRHTAPKTIQADCYIEGPGIGIEAVGDYCTNSGALVNLWVDHTTRDGKRRTTSIDIDALAKAIGPLIGDSWQSLADDKLAELLGQDAENAACDWADHQNDMRRDDAA